MRNLLNEAPAKELHGRLRFTCTYVDQDDITGRDVLEIGSGYGWFALNAGPRSRSFIGVEPTDDDLRTARKYVTHPQVRFERGSALALPFEPGSFDTVVSWEVLEHIPKGSEPVMFAEARRVLRPGGAFYLSTPFASLRSTALDPAYFLTGHRHYRARDLQSYAAMQGLEVRRLTVVGGWWEILQWWDIYVSKWILRRPPLFSTAMNRRNDRQFEHDDGFVCLFAAMRRPM